MYLVFTIYNTTKNTFVVLDKYGGVCMFLTILPVLSKVTPSKTLTSKHNLINEESKNVQTLCGTKFVVYW
jgi:hypothetical protein